MGGERADSCIAQDQRCDFLPKRRIGDLRIQNMVDGHCFGRYGAARIDETSAALFRQRPVTITVQSHILPADLADLVAAVAGSLQINDADAL
ncbi:hypothetical protein D3C80_1772460 [compost metagenome]